MIIQYCVIVYYRKFICSKPQDRLEAEGEPVPVSIGTNCTISYCIINRLTLKYLSITVRPIKTSHSTLSTAKGTYTH